MLEFLCELGSLVDAVVRFHCQRGAVALTCDGGMFLATVPTAGEALVCGVSVDSLRRFF